MRGDLARALRAVVRDEPVAPLPGIVDAAAYHGIISLVRQALPDLPGIDDLQLGEQGVRLRALHDLGLVSQVCGDRPWAVVKGPVLSEVVYRTRGSRGFSDLDVLVQPADFGRVIADLEAAGAALIDRNWRMAAEQQRSELALRLPGGTVLDLHWSLLNEPDLRRSLPLPDLLAHRVPVVLGESRAFRLDPVDALVHVCLHATLSGGHRLVWVRDVLESLQEAPLEQVLRRADELGLALPVRTMLRRAFAVAGGYVAVPGGWGRLMQGLAHWLPPGRGWQLRPSGATVVAATRGSTFASARALARRFYDRKPLKLHADELATQVDDEWRARYLNRVVAATL